MSWPLLNYSSSIDNSAVPIDQVPSCCTIQHLSTETAEEEPPHPPRAR